MAQKAITIYTPATATPHIMAEDDAQLHRGLLGGSGILMADNNLALTKIDDNTVRMASGVFSNQGYIVVVQGGTTIDLAIDNGTAGAYRHDLIVSHFTRGGGTTPDSNVIEVVKGTEASTAATAADPTLTQNDLTTGGSERQEPIWRVVLEGTSITAIERVAVNIGNVYQ